MTGLFGNIVASLHLALDTAPEPLASPLSLVKLTITCMMLTVSEAAGLWVALLTSP